MKRNISFTLLLVLNAFFIKAENTDEEILRLLNLNSDLTETVKSFDQSFVEKLTQRNEPIIYNY